MYSAKRRSRVPPLFGGATGQDDVHTTGEAFTGTKSGRGLTAAPSRNTVLRVSLWNELVYDEVQFVNRDLWERYGIPDIFGEDQLVFYEHRNRHSMIIVNKASIIQIEARQG